MKTDSVEIMDTTLVSNIVSQVQQIESQLKTAANTTFPITEVRVNIKDNRVFVVWDDYTDDEQVLQAIIPEIETNVQSWRTATDEVDRMDAIMKLKDIEDSIKQYNVNVRDIAKAIPTVKQEKANGNTIDNIVTLVRLPLFVVRAIYAVV